jgi:serine/threonine protein kinase
MGEVYRARDTRLERTVAIKILPSQFSADPVHKELLEGETLAQRLQKGPLALEHGFSHVCRAPIFILPVFVGGLRRIQICTQLRCTW